MLPLLHCPTIRESTRWERGTCRNWCRRCNFWNCDRFRTWWCSHWNGRCSRNRSIGRCQGILVHVVPIVEIVFLLNGGEDLERNESKDADNNEEAGPKNDVLHQFTIIFGGCTVSLTCGRGLLLQDNGEFGCRGVRYSQRRSINCEVHGERIGR